MTTIIKQLAVVLALLVSISCRGMAAESGQSDGKAYLFSTFKEGFQDGLRFAYSRDGYRWTNIAGVYLKPEVGGKILRDPSIASGPDGTFHLVWTTAWRGTKGFGHASSTNLIHWSEQQHIEAMEHEPGTVNVWAPELFYDDGSRPMAARAAVSPESAVPRPRFIICWASTIPGRFPEHLETPTNNHRMYFTTTSDFKTFTPARLFLDPDFSVIDCQILKMDRESRAQSAGLPPYVLLLKDNSRPQRNIRVAFGESPLGPWRNVSPPFTEKFTEGPCALKVGDEWLIYFDVYQKKAYGAVKTRDFKTFTDISDRVSFPEGHKHGTAFEVPEKILEGLLKHSARGDEAP